jgi:hypothetical protein
MLAPFVSAMVAVANAPSTASVPESSSWGLSRSLTRTRPSADASLRTPCRRELRGMRSEGMNLCLGHHGDEDQVGETAKERVRRRKEERFAVHRAAYEAELRDARVAAFNDLSAARKRTEEDETFEGTVNDGMPGTWATGWDLLADDKNRAVNPGATTALKDANGDTAEEPAVDGPAK